MFGSFFKRDINNSSAEEMSSQSMKSEIESSVNQTDDENRQINKSMNDMSTNKGLFWMRFDRRIWDNEESVPQSYDQLNCQRRKQMRKEFMEMRDKLKGGLLTHEAMEEYKKSASDKWQSMNKSVRCKWNNALKSDEEKSANITEKETKIIVNPSISDTTMKLMSSSTRMSIRC